MMQQGQSPATGASHGQPESVSSEEAPPKQVALALDRLGSAGRVIADIRLGADRLLEAVLATDEFHQVEKSLHLIVKKEASMRQHLQDLRTLGRQLEDSGVLNGSLRSRGNSWGLHMPLVCPDGAVVAYAWKRQLAGQAGASAVDRTRLALKAFTDQKRRFFPHLEDEFIGQVSASEFGGSKRHCGTRGLPENDGNILLSDILINLEKESPNMKIFTYQRLDWLKRASSLLSSADDNSMGPSKEQSFPNSSKTRLATLGSTSADQVAIVELLVPSVFRAIVSLHPAGSTYPSAVAFFSPDEGGNYVHARGFSVYHVFRHITEHADKALHYFLSAKPDTPLSHLLHWICSYQTLFTKACSKCGRILTMDKPLALLLPPVHRPYRRSSTINFSSAELTSSAVDQSSELNVAYHIGCSDEFL